MNDGYIKLYRVIMTDRALDDPSPYDRRSAYVDLYISARFQDDVASGLKAWQMVVSVRELAARWKWSNDRVFRFLKDLEESGIITLSRTVVRTQLRTQRRTLLTIVNKGFAEFDRTHPRTQDRTLTRTQVENEKESIKEKDKELEKKEEKGRKDLSTPTEYLNPKETDRQLKERFEVLWKLYPRKEGKDLAFRAYKAAVKDGVPDETIREGIERYKAHLAEEGTEIRYTLHGGTWFNQRRWTDEYESKTVPVEPPKQEIRTQVVKTKFSNFDERKIDYDALFANRKNKVGW